MENRLNMLSRLAGMKFRSLVRREFDWVVHFDAETTLVIECLWRLVDSGRIRLTSEDDGHQFGLAAPIDAAAEVTTLLSGTEVLGVDVREGLLDLNIRFDGGRTLQVMPNSSGYEAWHLTSGKNELIAAGGGNLATYDTVETSARDDRSVVGRKPSPVRVIAGRDGRE
jgi:hypothetical protein